MAKFLTTNGVILEIENIIKEAKKKLILISPYVQINKMLLERLQNASDKGVEITFIYGKSELNKIEKNKLETIENLKLYFYENLHAKCYFNEKIMVITSMNLYDFSEKNNREMGVLINKVDDSELFNSAVEEAFSIIKAIKEKVKIIKGNLMFPLKSEEYKIIQTFFEKKFYHSKINSTESYVFCSDLFPFSNLMIREGFELRLFQTLYNETSLVNTIKTLTLSNLNYLYNIEVVKDKWTDSKILISPLSSFDLRELLADFEKIYSLILSETQKISYKKRNLFM